MKIEHDDCKHVVNLIYVDHMLLGNEKRFYHINNFSSHVYLEEDLGIKWVRSLNFINNLFHLNFPN